MELWTKHLIPAWAQQIKLHVCVYMYMYKSDVINTDTGKMYQWLDIMNVWRAAGPTEDADI